MDIACSGSSGSAAVGAVQTGTHSVCRISVILALMNLFPWKHIQD